MKVRVRHKRGLKGYMMRRNDVRMIKRGGLLFLQGEARFLSTTLGFSAVSHLAHMTHVENLKLPLISELAQTRLTVATSDTEWESNR